MPVVAEAQIILVCQVLVVVLAVWVEAEMEPALVPQLPEPQIQAAVVAEAVQIIRVQFLAQPEDPG
jgi:hypothetical protein